MPRKKRVPPPTYGYRGTSDKYMRSDVGPMEKNRSNRRGFWLLMSFMAFLTLCCGSAAVHFGKVPASLGTKERPSVGFWRLNRSEAYAATVPQAHSLDLKALDEVPLVSLPSPKYEDNGLVLDEIVLEEDLRDNSRLIRRRDKEAVDLSHPPLSLGISKVSIPLPETGVLLQKVDALESMLQSIEGEKDPWIEHTVASGELLGDISRKYGIFTATICKANDISNPNRLAMGQVLLIPRTENDLDAVLEEQQHRKEKAAAEKHKAEPIAYQEYVVKNGDSLWTIANSFKLTVDSIYGCNTLKNPDAISPGTKLRIPNQDGMSVKVTKGQTVAGLAKKYDASEIAIQAANGLKAGDTLKIGQELFIPGASQAVAIYRSSSAGGGASGRAPSVAKAPADAAGRFSWPVSGRINSPFGWRRHPIGKKRSFHSGLDIKASRHTPIKAAGDGQVIFSGWMNGYGRTVIIRHSGNYTTLYAHAQKLLVRKGQRVSRGTVIAHVGSSGRSTGPHLHFEIRRGDKPTNPMSYLR